MILHAFFLTIFFCSPFFFLIIYFLLYDRPDSTLSWIWIWIHAFLPSLFFPSTSSLLPLLPLLVTVPRIAATPPSLPFSPSGLLVCSYMFEFQKRREEEDAAVFCFVVLIVYSGLVSGPG
ncbi:hypothetical protein DFH08DRAFT_906560 [Mycena albidolilacea]|uniref:Uncharacterized protein n=1 Tax=Mycena albidolilacea TaxID=1033008 RepID=A0AAD7E7E0_9AGAR|nr:hypothetical protein DFH08DRAFT_906560 [Mycena albidolilacea]